jgi:glycosyltransferase involved in cell wall biosynthesis
MHVLMVNLGYAPDVIGGAETTVHTLAHALVERGARVSIAALSSRGHDWNYDDAGVRVHFLAAHPMGNLLLNEKRTLPQRVLWQLVAEWPGWSGNKIAKLACATRPDIIHTHNLVGLSTSAWTIARDRATPSVHTLHGYQLLCPYGTMRRGSRLCGRQCSSCRVVTTARRHASAIPAAVIGNSAFNLRTHVSVGYFAHATQHVIPNAPPPAATPDEHGVSARPFGIERLDSPSPLRIGYLGRLAPYKGTGLLLEALARLPKSGWVGKIAGTGLPRYAQYLQQRIQHFDLPVTFAGWADPDQFLRDIDVLVVPSLIAEPQGMGVLEAVSRHVPVVYADLGGLAEIAAASPGTVPFAGGSAHDLARVLDRFVQTPAELSALRHGTYATNPLCDVGLYADRYMAVYRRALAAGCRPGARVARTTVGNRPDSGRELGTIGGGEPMTETARAAVARSRVLVLHYDLYYFGGAELLCCRILAVLQQHFSEIVLLHGGGPLDVARIEAWSGVRLNPARVRFETAPLPRWLTRLGRIAGGANPILLQYAMVLRAARSMSAGADLVVSTEGECPLAARRVIQYIHYPMFFFDRGSLTRLGATDLGLGRWLVRSCYVIVSRLVSGWSRAAVASQLTLANSKWTAVEFGRHYSAPDAQVVPAGAEVSLRPGSPDWLPFAQREDNFVVLGRIVPGKRIAEAIEIVSRLRARGWGLGLHIIGGEPTGSRYAMRIRTLLANKPWARRHVGLSRAEVERLIARQKWGLHCYRFEHYGIAPAELQCLGCIVFVHDSGGQREIIVNPAQRYTDVVDAVEKIDAILSAPSKHPALLRQAAVSAAEHTVDAFNLRFSRIIDEIAASIGLDTGLLGSTLRARSGQGEASDGAR